MTSSAAPSKGPKLVNDLSMDGANRRATRPNGPTRRTAPEQARCHQPAPGGPSVSDLQGGRQAFESPSAHVFEQAACVVARGCELLLVTARQWNTGGAGGDMASHHADAIRSGCPVLAGTSLLAVDRDFECGADLRHSVVTEPSDAVDQDRDREALDRVEVDGAGRGTGSSVGSSTTSLPSPRIVVVHGATITRCESRDRRCRGESTTTGRRPISVARTTRPHPREGWAISPMPRRGKTLGCPTRRAHRGDECRTRRTARRAPWRGDAGGASGEPHRSVRRQVGPR